MAGFDHKPNEHAALWIINNVLPFLRKLSPNFRLFLAGSNPPSSLSSHQSDSIIVTGHISEDELRELYLSSRVALAPIFYGAGFNVKLVEYMYYGLPFVGSTYIGRCFENVPEFMNLFDDPNTFANMIFKLQNNDKFWLELSESGFNYVRENFANNSLNTALDKFL